MYWAVHPLHKKVILLISMNCYHHISKQVLCICVLVHRFRLNEMSDDLMWWNRNLTCRRKKKINTWNCLRFLHTFACDPFASRCHMSFDFFTLPNWIWMFWFSKIRHFTVFIQLAFNFIWKNAELTCYIVKLN